MERQRVFVTRRVPHEAIDLLWADLDVEVWPGEEAPPHNLLVQRAGECVAFLTTVEDQIGETVLAAGRGSLKVVANCAVGVDNFDVETATRLGVAMCNTPDVLTKTTADLTFALILATARQVARGDRDVRDGNWKSWHPFAYTGPDVHGATLGIIGLGRIGLEVAKRALGFEMKVLYHSSTRRMEVEKLYGLSFRGETPSVLKEADFVSLHVPLTENTHHMIGRGHLRLMKPTAILVNTARGAIVDPIALYEALRDGLIAGAGLDVTEPEPIPSDHPLLTLPNVLITPHIGSASLQTRREMALLAARNILSVLKCQKAPSCLNPEVLSGR